MYKVVIIDDESLIVEGLKKVVPWQEYRCEVVATAYDGETGVAAIREHHPDILMTDIRMPSQDGLQMLAGLRSEFPDMLVVVLTGFRDFEYAQEALHLGVKRYLVKPSRMEDILEALAFLTSELEARQRAKAPAAPPIEEAEGAEEGDDVAADSAHHFLVRNALRYMEEHSSEKLTLPQVAVALFVSHWHLSKLLNKVTGRSFSDILHSIRIAKAKELLKNPQMSIQDIALTAGYSDTAYFSHMFKKFEKCSPGEYRNRYAK